MSFFIIMKSTPLRPRLSHTLQNSNKVGLIREEMHYPHFWRCSRKSASCEKRQWYQHEITGDGADATGQHKDLAGCFFLSLFLVQGRKSYY